MKTKNGEKSAGLSELLRLMHDAAVPINTIKGSVGLLKSGKLTEEDTRKVFGIMEERLERLTQVLDEFYKHASRYSPAEKDKTNKK